MSVLGEWDSFYLIVGPAAGALIGLQFVVMSLVADRPQPGVSDAARAFATPTVVHFSACLLLSALLRVPWPVPGYATWACGAAGLCGLVYMVLPVRRMLRQRVYKPDLEDMAFHVVLPFASYVLLLAAAWLGRADLEGALFGIGGAALLLLFIGIHNAWDAVAYQVYVLRKKDQEQDEARPAP